MKTLENKAVLVTGGSRGIGAAIVKRLANEGADVAFTYVAGKEQADALVKEIETLGRKAVAIQADSANAESVIAAVETTAARLGKIDILVNNAGVAVMGPLDQFSLEDYNKTFDINVRAVFVAIKAAVKHMASGGRIINIGSTNATRMPFEGGSVYAASKAAVQGLTMALSRDLGPQGITINNLQPGPVNTDMNPDNGPFADLLRTQLPIGRYGEASEVASFVAYLAGPEAGYITGASLNIDGGFMG
ncbi:3-oxoacyl-ACP reductase family protein [Flavobacterium subsaxonicum]|uniref:Oxidoreductase n=1 Tax=Flavobacterium subsaxonicum WB 4.1-42 = DSM 21790 TaxID=1121898 RepID=A0A0A2MJE4_9FLAO|nr:3-oxoacyl-ACP reductase family protein [Flavobacterium subsaxonicum]KGO91671.1 oxidoreductase [Flavobacterium subsaxonicum WB 4.1-42 = DSM 21790]